MAERYANNALSTLDGSITAGAATLTVTDPSTFPDSGDFRLRVDDELMLVTAVAGSVFTVTRGIEDTTPAEHLDGAVCYLPLTVGSLSLVQGPPGDTGPTGATGATGATGPGVASGGAADQVLAKIDATDYNTHWVDQSATTPVMHGCRLRQSGDTSLPATTTTPVPFDTEDYDTDAYHSLVSNTTRVTIPVGLAGYYLITWQASVTYASGTPQIYMGIRLNGATPLANATPAPFSAGIDSRATVSTVAHLAEGDYVEGTIYVSTLLTAGHSGSAYPVLSVTKVG